MSMPTQVAHPWRSTIRTGFQVVLGLAVLLPFVLDASGIPETAPGVALALAVSGGVARVMALPQVDEFLERFVPWLATGVHTESANYEEENTFIADVGAMSVPLAPLQIEVTNITGLSDEVARVVRQEIDRLGRGGL